MEEQKSHVKDKRGREANEIPNDDVLEEILMRLPVKTLLRFQIVSKHWRHTIKSKSFRERYMLHQKTKDPKFLCIYEGKNWYEPNFALMTMRLEWSSSCLVEEEVYHISYEHKANLVVFSTSLDGLFLIYGGKNLNRPIMVINPANRWSQTLPLARIQLEHCLDNNKREFSPPGFGKDCVTGIYKLVLLHNINNTSSCEVFDFGAKQWRQVVPPPPPNHRIKHEHAPTFANGWLYWFSQDKTMLVAFDLHMEIFRVVPNPIIEASSSSSSSVEMSMRSVDDDRRLVWISEINGDGMQHVWRLTNHNTGGALLKMGKMFSFDLNKVTSTWFDDDTNDPSSLLRLEAISKNGGNKVMLSKQPGSENLLLFQPQNPTSIHNRIFSYSPARPSDSLLLPYFPSLASPL
ncbi:putative F-box protein At2g02030 [Arabidopsis lyrata subsp. lyrata]|uniref:putative F-box protein At2g02030 n=1 Tax=Arabidopsis lyrata subsp. lyrata TaxID=81972 RepID=UPI000A29E5A8|nr:putative F-box protein At2g02030 [Arabidopsis lyrata subsp. lyrata]|eukprot:XP_020880689.1 putative F-box protein At2g02030 [Arabidopsis lyrata subsp. lyrata]